MLALTLFLALVAAAACGGDDGGADDGGEAQLSAVTSLELFADMVRQVGGDRVEVEALLPSGADPHTFELSPGRVASIARADVVFINGLGLEESIEDVIRTNAGGRVVELSAGLSVIGGTDQEGEEQGQSEDDHDHAEGNPHMWLDGRRAATYVETIRNVLIEEDGGGRDEYEANASAYLAELERLDRELEAAIAAIPIADRQLVTFHDAFPYFAARYGLTIVDVVVPSSGQEPSARDVAELTETLRDSGVKAAFKEPQFSSDILDQAAADAGIPVLDLLSDAYIEDVDSYVELMQFNLAQLQEGLEGG